jgi:15-cis-phytoene synthase
MQPIDIPSSFAAAREICRRHAKSFYFASHFLPKRKRQHAYAVYAFCRLLDDAVDEAQTPAAMEQGLSTFAGYLDSVYHDRPMSDPPAALHAFAATVKACNIPRQYFDDLAHGCRMDLTIHRYHTWAELEKYCYHVAGVVGLMMCRVFELKEEAALGQAVHMGNAMQLTNILRDVGEDYRQRGRIYLPLDEGYASMEEDIAGSKVTGEFVDVMKMQIARARQLYMTASQGLAALDRDGSRQTACVMSVVYAGILRAIEDNRHDSLSQRASVSLVGKLRRIPKALKLARLERGQAVPDDIF